MRALLSWGIGCLLLTNDEVNNFDLRLQVRGNQKANEKIVILQISPEEVASFGLTRRSRPFPYAAQMGDITDSFFWDKLLWQQVLERAFKQNPSAVGVTLFFGENISDPILSSKEKILFKDNRLIWLANFSPSEILLPPRFANSALSNIGFLESIRDEDGKVRRFRSLFQNTNHISNRLSGRLENKISAVEASELINFGGDQSIFEHYSFTELITNQVPKNAFTGKIVIVGATSLPGQELITPMGAMSRSELVAHITAHQLSNRKVIRAPLLLYISELFLILFFGLFVIFNYPQGVAGVFLLIFGILNITLSIWLFDTFNFWVPVVSPTLQLLTTWIVFVGYLASKIERKNWQLQQERKSLDQLELLKNNFLSMMSHDLKTPIAKIQAILDRIMNQGPPPELVQDLKSIKSSSEELHRYIHSILRVSRVESKNFKIEMTVVDVNDLLTEVIENIEPLANEKQIQFEISLEPLFSTEGDPTLLKEVFSNIIENAIKYTPIGGMIKISSTEIDDFITVVVEDTGEGISPDEIELIFGKFVRGKSQDLRTKGTGLGLYLVKYFVELHGGRVSLTSQLGKGSKFTVLLPTEVIGG